jgi:formylglycine-generating enzyme required for sulfatase activity
MPATAPKVSFLLRQPRLVQGYREPVVPQQGLSDQTRLGDALLSDAVELTMVWIPPGRFWMGSPSSSVDRADADVPQHLVQVQGFFISQMPITQAQWRAVAKLNEGSMGRHDLKPNPSLFHPDHWQGKDQTVRYRLGALLAGEGSTDDRPVERVSWHDALEFCHRLGRLTGRAYTLPSEAQWEFACRAGNPEAFTFGATLTPTLANVRWPADTDISAPGRHQQQTTPVGLYPANAWGLHDMHGNVGEWCFDHWREGDEAATADDGPWLIKDDRELLRERVIRGGSWNSEAIHCRSASRTSGAPLLQDMKVGFRVVCLPHLPTEQATQQTGELLASEQDAEISIAELNVSSGIEAALKGAGVNAVSDLMGFSYEDLIGIPGIGSRQADDIIEALEKIGITNPQSRVEGED